MERRVSVNADKGSAQTVVGWEALADSAYDQTSPEEWDQPERSITPAIEDAKSEPLRRNHRPCLYLGPRGQRCRRPSEMGTFCAVHGSARRAPSIRNSARILAAATAILALLWPYIQDLVGEIVRWAHGH